MKTQQEAMEALYRSNGVNEEAIAKAFEDFQAVARGFAVVEEFIRRWNLSHPIKGFDRHHRSCDIRRGGDTCTC
jgi:hypothetical protein